MKPHPPHRPAWRRVARTLLPWFLLWTVLDRTIRWALVRRFFRRAASDLPPPPSSSTAVTLVQPILSGDPHLGDNLRANAGLRADLPLRWVWAVDADDAPGRQLTAAILGDLARSDPAARARIELRLTPPAPDGVNPKTFKLRLAWEALDPTTRAAANTVFGVLDDDTRLDPGQLETAAGELRGQPGTGLVFGLPYYLSFGTFWSAMVSTFVNRNSLWSYLPILQLGPPMTINGMFWLARGEAIAALGGFRTVENMVCDDYAVARGVRAAGFTLRQTAVVHGLRTGVANARAYDRMLTRWFIFPQVSLLRHEPRPRLAGFVALVFLPSFQFLGALALAAAAGRWRGLAAGVAVQGWREGLQVDLERRFLPGATGRGVGFWGRRAVGWLVDALVPAQIVRALLAPREIDWRGHRLRLDPDGRFAYVRRRGSGGEAR